MSQKSKARKAAEKALTRATSAVFAVLVRLLPLSALRRLADGAAWLIRVLAPSRQRIAVDNMRQVFGDRYSEKEYRQLAAQVTRGVARTMVELLKFPYLTQEQIQALVTVEGIEHLRAALAQGRGAIMVTAHYGNWELLGPVITGADLPCTAVARDSEETFTANLINRARQSHGVEVLARENLRGMLRTLRENRILSILPDQHAWGGSIIVDFLGRPAATAVGPATLALRTGCAVVPGFCRRLPEGGFAVEFRPALQMRWTGDREADVRSNTILVNQVLEQEILAHPEQWLWLHRRWKVQHAPAPHAESHGAYPASEG